MKHPSGPTNRVPSRGPRLRRSLRALLLAFAALAAPGAAAAVEVSLDASPVSPKPLGTMIRWTAVPDAASAHAWFRFRVREPGGEFRMVRDFSPASELDWTALDEGVFEVEVTARESVSQETATAISAFELVPRVEFGPAVAPTTHPLVFIFSSPGCETGRARVRFESDGGRVQYTPFKPCEPGRTLNFYLAGLAPNSFHRASLVVEGARSPAAPGREVRFQTGDASYPLGLPTVLEAASADSPDILLQSPLYQPPLATDSNGQMLWYGPEGLFLLTRPEPGGTFFGLLESRVDPARDRMRKFDLVGMTLLETNAARVSEQLVAMGKRPITSFHHEARTLRNGNIVLLAGVEQILTDVQRPGPVDVLADMIVVLDPDLQVVWSWDSFDHLDPARAALLDQQCPRDPGCAPYYLALEANDWTHSNSVAETPDGALLLSVRHQDWLVKIDYRAGEGNGDILWRLGLDGDFTFDSDDPYPWFSHQHDAQFEPGSRSMISLFDNGNRRRGLDPEARSRGQVLEIDEVNRRVRLVLNADLGLYSPALGSAQRLPDGQYQFAAGFVRDATAFFGGAGYTLGVDGAGTVFSSMKLLAPVYRSFVLPDIYGPAAATGRSEPRVVDFRN
jgi:hypothetical protein